MADAGTPVGDLRPLLAFPAPATGRIPPSEGPNRFRPVKRPSAGRQGTRLTPQFDALRAALDGGHAQLAESTTAPDPELVAVFDLAGAVDGFLRAASQVEGLEFLSELQEDYVESDDDFYYEDKGERSDDGVPQPRMATRSLWCSRRRARWALTSALIRSLIAVGSPIGDVVAPFPPPCKQFCPKA